jgi:hypothetical protein
MKSLLAEFSLASAQAEYDAQVELGLTRERLASEVAARSRVEDDLLLERAAHSETRVMLSDERIARAKAEATCMEMQQRLNDAKSREASMQSMCDAMMQNDTDEKPFAGFAIEVTGRDLNGFLKQLTITPKE